MPTNAKTNAVDRAWVGFIRTTCCSSAAAPFYQSTASGLMTTSPATACCHGSVMSPKPIPIYPSSKCSMEPRPTTFGTVPTRRSPHNFPSRGWRAGRPTHVALFFSVGQRAALHTMQRHLRPNESLRCLPRGATQQSPPSLRHPGPHAPTPSQHPTQPRKNLCVGRRGVGCV